MGALHDVDCPDWKQPYGKQAKHAAVAYLANREVVVGELKNDHRGRTTAGILLTGGRFVEIYSLPIFCG